MFKLLALLNQNCRTATRLVLAARERTLTGVERAGLAGHLMICPSCRRYRGEVEQLERLTQEAVDRPTDGLSADGQPVAADGLPVEARERIAHRLTDGHGRG